MTSGRRGPRSDAAWQGAVRCDAVGCDLVRQDAVRQAEEPQEARRQATERQGAERPAVPRTGPERSGAAPPPASRRAKGIATAAMALPLAILASCDPGSLEGPLLAARAESPAAPAATPSGGETAEATAAGSASSAALAPLFTGTAIASDPSVIRDGATLRMSYTDYDWQSGHTVISTAASADGARWTPAAASASPVVRGTAVAPAPGSWRENVEGSALIKTGGGYRLYFSGYRDRGHPQKGFPASLGLATSTDGANWTVRDTPVIDPTPGWYDNDAIYSPAIVETGNGLFLAYAGHSYTDASRIERPGVYLLGARSIDGIRWEKLPAPLLPATGGPAWMRDGAAEPALLPLGDGRWVLLFTGLAGEERVIGVATGPAPEGPFRIRPDPLIVPGTPGLADNHQVLAPSALLDGERVRIWYLAASRSGALAVAYREAPVDEIAAR